MFLFSLSIVHGCAVQKTAIDDCIDSMKIEVKQKIDDHLDGSWQSEMLNREMLSHIIPIFVKTYAAMPENASCHACAIMPGRKLLRRRTSVPNMAP